MGDNILLAMMVAGALVAAADSALAFIAPHRVDVRKVADRWMNLLLTLGLVLLTAAFVWKEMRGGELSFALVNIANLLVLGHLATGWILRRRARAGDAPSDATC